MDRRDFLRQTIAGTLALGGTFANPLQLAAVRAQAVIPVPRSLVLSTAT